MANIFASRSSGSRRGLPASSTKQRCNILPKLPCVRCSMPAWNPCASDWKPLSQTIRRSEEHTSELQSLMRISYAVFCLKKKKIHKYKHQIITQNKYKLKLVRISEQTLQYI